MKEKYEICCDMMHDVDRSKWVDGTAAERVGLLAPAQQHILVQDDGTERFSKAMDDLSRAFALCAAPDETTETRGDEDRVVTGRSTVCGVGRVGLLRGRRPPSGASTWKREQSILVTPMSASV